MAESDPHDSDLLWYLEKLSRKEGHSLRSLLGQECAGMGLPAIPRLELSEETPQLANQLTMSYEVQHLWSLLYSIFHKIPRRDLCETIDARRTRSVRPRLEGLLHHTLHFTEENLGSVGFSQADIAMLLGLEVLWPSSHPKGHYRFVHTKIQEFCAALAFLLPLQEHRLPSVTARGRCLGKRELGDDFGAVLASLFGLLHEERRQTFQEALGCSLRTDHVGQHLLAEMRRFGENPKALGHHTPLFHCLFENQEEGYVRQAMDAFLEAAFYVRDHRDLLVSSYCLGHCRRLRKLKLTVQNVFENKSKEQPTPSLTNCNLETSAYRHLASLLLSSKTLKKLTLSKNALSMDGLKIFCDALYHPNCVLESLVLLFCCLSLHSISLILKSLVLTVTLKHLDVSVNNIQDRGVQTLMMALVFPTCSVRELEISGCFFTDKGCEYMVYVLKDNPNLKSLELGSNNIGDAGMELLCGAMRHPDCNLENIGSRTLKKINLLGNKLGDEGIVRLLESLAHPCCVLQTIGLDVKDLNAETMELFTIVTNRKSHLHVTDQSWVRKEGREVSCSLGDVSLSRSVLRLPDLPWNSLSSDSRENGPPP